MPELPEVEVLRRHLQPVLRARRILEVHVHRPRIVRPTTPRALERALRDARVLDVQRRGKYLVFQLRSASGRPFELLGHLGMTGRMFLLDPAAPLPRHTAVDLRLDRGRFVFEDVRYFGRLTLDVSPLARLGPEPLSPAFTPAALAHGLAHSRQAIKIRLLDQSVVAGVGNIYASEALFRARISPRRAAGRLTAAQIRRLHRAVQRVLTEAIRWGSTVPLDWSGTGAGDGLFYYGQAPGAGGTFEERLRVYDRAGQPCPRCATALRRIVQASRSTFYCPDCQRGVSQAC